MHFPQSLLSWADSGPLASHGGSRYLRGWEPPCALRALREHGELLSGAAHAGGRGVLWRPFLLLEQVGDVRGHRRSLPGG